MSFSRSLISLGAGVAALASTTALTPSSVMAQDKKPNIVMLMTDDTGWNDFGAYSGGGKGLGHPTPNVDKIAAEGATFTDWYGQASCTAGRASFITGRLPIRSALSIVVAPGVTIALTWLSTWRTICPLRRIFSISGGDLRTILSSPKPILTDSSRPIAVLASPSASLSRARLRTIAMLVDDAENLRRNLRNRLVRIHHR